MTWFDWPVLDFIQTHLRSGMLDTLMVWITTLGNGGAIWLAIAAVLVLRPCALDPSVQLLIHLPTDYSFPSGHTSASFAAVAALYYFRCRYWYLAGILAVLIAFSRLYLYVHFPTDVLAGALIGLMLGWCSVAVIRLIFRKADQKRRNKRC